MPTRQWPISAILELVEDSTGFVEIKFFVLSRLIDETIQELLSEISQILLQIYRIQTQCYDDLGPLQTSCFCRGDLILQVCFRELLVMFKARFKRRNLHVPNLIPIWVDPNNLN